MVNQFKQNEIFGREQAKILFKEIGIDNLKFTTGEYDNYDFSFEYRGKKCIVEIKYLYKYNPNRFDTAYAEEKKLKAMSEYNEYKMFYLLIYNNGDARLLDVTNWLEFEIEEKLAPKYWNSEERILKRFINIPYSTGVYLKSPKKNIKDKLELINKL